MKYLCDTNIIGELARKKANAGVTAWADGIVRIEISVITLEEIFFGLSWKPNDRIQNWFESFVETYCGILPVSPSIAKRAGFLRGNFQTRGKVRTQADMLIAATAQEHGLTLVTRNDKDFVECGIAILNPFV